MFVSFNSNNYRYKVARDCFIELELISSFVTFNHLSCQEYKCKTCPYMTYPNKQINTEAHKISLESELSADYSEPLINSMLYEGWQSQILLEPEGKDKDTRPTLPLRRPLNQNEF